MGLQGSNLVNRLWDAQKTSLINGEKKLYTTVAANSSYQRIMDIAGNTAVRVLQQQRIYSTSHSNPSTKKFIS